VNKIPQTKKRKEKWTRTNHLRRDHGQRAANQRFHPHPQEIPHRIHHHLQEEEDWQELSHELESQTHGIHLEIHQEQ